MMTTLAEPPKNYEIVPKTSADGGVDGEGADEGMDGLRKAPPGHVREIELPGLETVAHPEESIQSRPHVLQHGG